MERSRVTGKAKHILKQFKAWVRNVKQNSGSAHISRVVFFFFFHQAELFPDYKTWRPAHKTAVTNVTIKHMLENKII